MPTPQNGQIHSNNLSARGDELCECVWPFCGVGLKGLRFSISSVNGEGVRSWLIKEEDLFLLAAAVLLQ